MSVINRLRVCILSLVKFCSMYYDYFILALLPFSGEYKLCVCSSSEAQSSLGVAHLHSIKWKWKVKVTFYSVLLWNNYLPIRYRHRLSGNPAYRLQASPAPTGPGLLLTAMPRPNMPFNGLQLRNPCQLHGSLLIYRPRRDGRLSWPSKCDCNPLMQSAPETQATNNNLVFSSSGLEQLFHSSSDTDHRTEIKRDRYLKEIHENKQQSTRVIKNKLNHS